MRSNFQVEEMHIHWVHIEIIHLNCKINFSDCLTRLSKTCTLTLAECFGLFEEIMDFFLLVGIRHFTPFIPNNLKLIIAVFIARFPVSMPCE